MHHFKTKEQAELSETEKAVAGYLAAINVVYLAVCLGERKDDDGWVHDKFDVHFTRNPSSMDVDFRSGIGNRVAREKMPADVRKANPRSLYVEDWIKRNVKPQSPAAASVIHSLIMDSSACDVSFHNWADEYGLEKDSIRARNIYDACQENGERYMKFFTVAEREKLAELLEDY